MLDYDKNTFKKIVFISCIFAFLFMIANVLQLAFLRVNNESSKYLEKEVKNIKVEIEKYRQQNEKLQKDLIKYDYLLLKIDSGISKNNKKIDKLKLSTDEKINSFKSYDARMWERFFTDRYKK